MMKPSKLRVALLTLLLMASTQAAAAPILDIAGGSTMLSGGAFNLDAVIGWRFTVTSPITVGALGLWDEGSNGLLYSHQIGLWTNGGTLLASATLTNANSTSVASTSTDGSWRFTSISSVSLGAGDYVVGATYADNDSLSEINRYLVPTLSSIPGVAFVENRFAFSSSLVFPPFVSLNSGNAFFGPNVYSGELSEVSEPNSLLLAATTFVGLAGAWSRHRRKHRPRA